MNRLETPDYKKEWEARFNSIKEEIINAINNQSEINIILDHSPMRDAIQYKRDNSYIPELISIEGNTIKTKYTSPEFLELIVNNLSENVETLNVPGEILNYAEGLGMYPKLSTIKVTNNYEITEQNVNDINTKTKIEFIEAINFDGLTNEYNLNAIYYNGEFEELKMIDSNLRIKNPNKKIEISTNYFNIPNLYENINDVINYIKENDINISKQEFLNIITRNTDTDYLFYTKFDNEIEYAGDLTKIREFTKFIRELGLNPSYLFIKLENKDYDYKLFKGLDIPIIIDYGDEYSNATLEEFIAMRETIKYYKELITSSNLSPLEQVTYAYDIIKSFDYAEAEIGCDSRSMHRIINSGKIVCVGYAQFLKQVLKELGFKIEAYDVNSPEKYGYYPDDYDNHERNIIRIDDDKYNVHMVAACDPTWDSGTPEINTYRFSDKNATTLADVNNLISYINFIIPKNEYMFLFKDKDVPSFFSISPKIIASHFDEMPKIVFPSTNVDYALSMLQKLFDKGEGDLIEEYIEAKRPSYEIFRQVIQNVKQAEGYSLKESQIISKTIELEEPEQIKTR